MGIWDKTALVTVQVSTRATASLFVLFVSILVDTPMIVELELLFFFFGSRDVATTGIMRGQGFLIVRVIRLPLIGYNESDTMLRHSFSSSSTHLVRCFVSSLHSLWHVIDVHSVT